MIPLWFAYIFLFLCACGLSVGGAICLSEGNLDTTLVGALGCLMGGLFFRTLYKAMFKNSKPMKPKQIAFCVILVVVALLLGAALRHGSLQVVIAAIGAIAWTALVIGLYTLLLRPTKPGQDNVSKPVKTDL